MSRPPKVARQRSSRPWITLGGLDILVNNAGGVRAGRLESTPEAELLAMIDVDLVAPMFADARRPAGSAGEWRGDGRQRCFRHRADWRTVLRHLRSDKGRPRPIRRGAATRTQGRRHPCVDRLPERHRHADDEVESGGSELGFSREPASAVAAAILEGIEANAFEVIRGGEARAQMIALNSENPAALDERFLESQAGARGGGEGPFGALRWSGPRKLSSF